MPQLVHPLKLVFVLALAAIWAGSAFAFRLTPMRYILEPAGSNAEITLRLENTYGIDLPVEIEVYKRTINEDGIEERVEAEDDFLVFPPQSLVAAGGEQAFRVRYIGPPDIAEMQSYIVMVRQLALRQISGEGGNVELMLALGTAAYVSPRGTVADLAVSVETNPEDQSAATLWVENRGNAYGYVDMFDVTLTAADGSQTVVTAEEIVPALVTPLAMPNSRRKVILPLPEDLAGREIISAEISPAAR